VRAILAGKRAFGPIRRRYKLAGKIHGKSSKGFPADGASHAPAPWRPFRTS
jgi:hypothetical protein